MPRPRLETTPKMQMTTIRIHEDLLSAAQLLSCSAAWREARAPVVQQFRHGVVGESGRRTKGEHDMITLTFSIDTIEQDIRAQSGPYRFDRWPDITFENVGDDVIRLSNLVNGEVADLVVKQALTSPDNQRSDAVSRARTCTRAGVGACEESLMSSRQESDP